MSRSDSLEAASAEKRYWVRVTRACNNRCIFCLDADVQDGAILPYHGVRRQIERGPAEDRLVLSGGEPTIHPRFLDLVAAGKRAGYRWVQAITNGRMFSYQGFAREAADAGLDEVTVSVHGDEPSLQDMLCGVAGGFEQARAGIENLLSGRRIHVSVDVVINGLNYTRLGQIVNHFFGLGVREFDLLMIQPFGRAWGRMPSRLLCSPAKAAPYVRGVLAASLRKGFVVWTNRFPPEYLDGFEQFIQDPRKLHDELAGRMSEFDGWQKDGVPLHCRGPRCRFCFMRRFCDFFEKALSLRSRPKARLPPEAEDAAVYSGQLSVAEVRRHDVPPALMQKALKDYQRAFNYPLCLLPEGCKGGRLFIYPAMAQRENGAFDLPLLMDCFIQDHYYVKPLTCRKCSLYRRCPGIHINYLRAYGRQMRSLCFPSPPELGSHPVHAHTQARI